MDTLTLWLAGDVMTGRGIDQILPHPAEPTLYESYVRDAREYVHLAERVNGRVHAPVAPDYIWGEALAEIAQRQPDVRLINLETAITDGGHPWPDKGIHYRMHPANIGCLTAAHIDCCSLANNHVLDWGVGGLEQTLRTLRQAGIASVGAGMDAESAGAPVVLRLAGAVRLLVFAWALPDSGVRDDWRATRHRPGVTLLDKPGEPAAQDVAAHIARWRRPGDLVVVSLHWGGNWGMEVSEDKREFAHRLIDLGAADVIHGHSSHHPRPIEVYRDRLILYGCGDLINDYEGIRFQETFDASAVCLYFAQISRNNGHLQRLDLVPMRLRRLQLVRADAEARRSLQALFQADGKLFHTSTRAQADGSWSLRW